MRIRTFVGPDWAQVFVESGGDGADVVFETSDGIDEYRHLGLPKMVGADPRENLVNHFKIGGGKIFIRIVKLQP